MSVASEPLCPDCRTRPGDLGFDGLCADCWQAQEAELDAEERDERQFPLVVKASSVASRSIRWAWTAWLAIGYLIVQTGIEGLGKSLWAAWVIARITHGELPGEWRGKPANVLVIAGEDGIADTWRVRLDLAEADLDRVSFLNLDALPDKWNLRDGIGQLDAAVTESGANVVYIDAALDHMPTPSRGESINSPTFVRDALGPLRKLARERDLVVLFSMHPPKARSGDFRDLVQASQAFSAIPRIGVLLANHPEDDADDPDRRRVVLRGKGNLGRNPGALEFRVVGRSYTHDDGCTAEREVVVDVKPSTVTIADLAPERTFGTRREPTKAERAADYIREVLGDGQRHLAESIRKELDRQGIGSDSVVREAKRIANVRSEKRRGVKDGPWEWWIRTDDSLTPSPLARARPVPAQDAFPNTGENISTGAKASRSHDSREEEDANRRRPEPDGPRARAREGGDNGHVTDDVAEYAERFRRDHAAGRWGR